MIDSQLFGMFAGGHLLVNALIHAANTLLVFWLLMRTTHARWSSALVAALFALHPLHVESVAWAAERKDTLSTFFGLLSLIAYVRYAEAPSIRRYAWVAIMLALGLLAKPMLVTWPFVMLLLDYWPLGRFAAVIPSEVEDIAGRRKTSKLTPRGPSTSLGMTIKRSCRRKDTVVCSRGSVRSCHVHRAISSRRCTHLYGSSYYAATVERACLVCEIPAARFLAE